MVLQSVPRFNIQNLSLSPKAGFSVRSWCPIEVSRQHAREVGVIESQVDSLGWDLTKKIFTADLKRSHKLHLKICVEHIVDVTDKAEWAADHLEIVALKAMI